MPDVVEKIAVAAVLASLGVSCTSHPRLDSQDGGAVETRLARSRFVCSGDRCVQRYPRLPDDGEWTCSDMGGVAVCAGGDPPAGIPLNVLDGAWICGKHSTRRKTDDSHRVCVDLAADFPDGTARGWRCHYASEEGVTRVCDRDSAAHVIGDPCDARNPCLDGFGCISGRCTPEPPSPSCSIDADCDNRTCRFGSCWHGPE